MQDDKNFDLDQQPKEVSEQTNEQSVEQSDEIIGEQSGEQQPEEKNEQPAAKKKKSVKREILEWVLCIVGAVAIALVVRTFLFEFVRVDGQSMAETLQDGERMFVTKLDYWTGDPERFDVVICHYPDRGWTDFVKRVVGVPGDTVAMLNGTLILNGKAVDEPYITHKANYNMPAVTLGEDEYFVLGDNRSNSNDSHIIGPLKRNLIIGHVRCVIFPFNSFREISGDEAVIAA
ncbi:MAG: signal peptidase I [Clostridia bacterium]|nr:signal peptidase I [Clostridia bacterium]